MRELSLNVMDIAQNSISAGANLIKIDVYENKKSEMLRIKIMDNGCGMNEDQIKNVTNPFFTTRTTRKVGFGIPFFKMEAEMTGGSFKINSKIGVGTVVTAEFMSSHIDMIPLGNINSTVILLAACNEDKNFVFHHKVDSREFTLDTRKIRSALNNEVKLSSKDVIDWAKGYLEEQTRIIKGELSDEVFS